MAAWISCLCAAARCAGSAMPKLCSAWLASGWCLWETASHGEQRAGYWVRRLWLCAVAWAELYARCHTAPRLLSGLNRLLLLSPISTAAHLLGSNCDLFCIADTSTSHCCTFWTEGSGRTRLATSWASRAWPTSTSGPGAPWAGRLEGITFD